MRWLAGRVDACCAATRLAIALRPRRLLGSNPNSASGWFLAGRRRYRRLPMSRHPDDPLREIIMIDDFDTTSDCTDLVDLAWAEMDEFFKALGARGPASTPEQWEQDRIRFLEIQERCNSLVLAISERAESGNPRPH
jgi:hypothetical protein